MAELVQVMAKVHATFSHALLTTKSEPDSSERRLSHLTDA